ncbi:MAG TPA: hypothetical protein VGS28_00635 [Candidatus Saccharimonadales bacterium]|nr:hypothetical protein [Candidatus Saccharimonadales bacterium]
MLLPGQPYPEHLVPGTYFPRFLPTDERGPIDGRIDHLNATGSGKARRALAAFALGEYRDAVSDPGNEVFSDEAVPHRPDPWNGPIPAAIWTNEAFWELDYEQRAEIEAMTEEEAGAVLEELRLEELRQRAEAEAEPLAA